MSSLRITGGVPLSGQVTVRGAKNLVPKAMVAALLGSTPSVLGNVPEIKDVSVVTNLLGLHGVSVTRDGADGVLTLDPSNVTQARHADIDAHAGILESRSFVRPLLHALGEAFIPDLGGCRIGDRPINYHLEVLRNFGARVEKLESGIRMSAPHGLQGAKIDLPYPSVGATEQVLLTATRAEGHTELRGPRPNPRSWT